MTGPVDPGAVDPAVIGDRVAAIRRRISDAGGDPARVRLVAVTKGHPVAVVRAALAAGLVDLGESYGQELAAKADEVAEHPGPGEPPPVWHAIGRMQRNKVRLIAPHVALWQSVDRLQLAAEIARRAPNAAVLVQVDVTGEPTKGGCPPERAPGVVDACRDLGLDVRGLMAIGPVGAPPQAAFARLVALADALGLPERSIGMTGDLEAAVAEGSTMVRIGTALFGPRAGTPGVGH